MDAQRGCRCRGIICGFCACFLATHETVTERPLNLYWTGVWQRQVRNDGRASFLLASQPVTDAAIAADTVLAPSYTTQGKRDKFLPIWLIPQAGPLPSLHRSGSSRSPRATFPPLPPKRIRPQTTDHGPQAGRRPQTTPHSPQTPNRLWPDIATRRNVPASRKASVPQVLRTNLPTAPYPIFEKETYLKTEATRYLILGTWGCLPG